MGQTEQNLLDAFAGESQANRRYLAFAKQADKEGKAQAAKLFRAAAEAETVHAHAHLRALGGVKSTAENLKGPHMPLPVTLGALPLESHQEKGVGEG